jgi:thiopeptide-type bacteriocin biosynthesis protein
MSDAPAWIGLHVHYNSDMQSLLGEGVKPALAALRRDRLIAQAFMIRYWEQGPHVRVRLLPADASCAIQAEAMFRSIVEEFLLQRPSLYAFPTALMRVNFNDAYRREYGDAAFDRKYGALGRIPFAPNNSIQSVPYEPELDRYGGQAGMAIAERFFEASTDAVLDILTSPNGADLSVRAGHALKFLVLGCFVFLDSDQWVPFLDANKARWMRFLDVYKIAAYDNMVEKYARQRETLAEQMLAWTALLEGGNAVSTDESLILPAMRRARQALLAAHADGTLDAPYAAMDKRKLMEHMFTSYLHMHCNRLGMLAVDEIYLSILGREALSERLTHAGAREAA